MAIAASSSLHAWGVQGHRIIGLVAESHLTPAARATVARLLDKASLADVSFWADDYRASVGQTALWHFVDIPPDASAYDRDRDCPKQPEIIGGIRTTDWRDCVVDRILYNQQRLADAKLDRADRAIALKFLVHFVGDVHQPFHAIGPDGGNSVPIVAFGSPMCPRADGTTYPCNLHVMWDTTMIARRQLTDRQYVDVLARLIRTFHTDTLPAGTPADWATESYLLAKTAIALLGPGPVRVLDEAYYVGRIPTIDARLALAGLRLATMINQSLATPAADARR
jgi:hypothetical protein